MHQIICYALDLYNKEGVNVALTATLVDDQFWQDSNLARGTGGASQINAKIPSYEVLDLSAEYEISQSWSIQAGINNWLDED